jgi:hypothetical protein
MPILSGAKILVVDDDVHVAETLELIFLARGYKGGSPILQKTQSN